MFLTLVQGGSGARPLYGTTGPNPESATDSDTTLETNMYYTSSLDELTVENIDINGSATLNGSTITSWPTGGGGGGSLNNIVEDTTPELGGNLDGGSYTIEAALFHPNTSDASATEFASVGGSAAFGVPFGELRSNWSSGTYVPLKWGPSGITVAGYLNASGDIQAVNFNSTSDESLKENVQTITNALDKVDSLRGVNFDWIDSGKAATGVIAQEIETILPEVVTEDEDGIKHVAYGNVVGVLIEAIKELKAEIEDLKK
jgi:hypothetical protein